MSSSYRKQAFHFVHEAFRHYKAIGGTHEGTRILEDHNLSNSLGVILGTTIDNFVDEFTNAVAAHRHWIRDVM